MKIKKIIKLSILLSLFLGLTSCAQYVNEYLGTKIPEPKTFNKIDFTKETWGTCDFSQPLSKYVDEDISIENDVLEILIEGIPTDDLSVLTFQITADDSWGDNGRGDYSCFPIVTNLEKDTPFSSKVTFPVSRTIKKGGEYTMGLNYGTNIKEDPISINKFNLTIEKKSPGFTFAPADAKSKSREHPIKCRELITSTSVTNGQYFNISVQFDASKEIEKMNVSMTNTNGDWAALFFSNLGKISKGSNDINVSIPVKITSSNSETFNTDNCTFNLYYDEAKASSTEVLVLTDFKIELSVSDKAKYEKTKN